MNDEPIGYTADNQPVSLWIQRNAWTGAEEAFLEAGRVQIQLDHVDPGLVPALRASLKRGA